MQLSERRQLSYVQVNCVFFEQLRSHHAGDKKVRHDDEADPSAASDNEDETEAAGDGSGIAEGDISEDIPVARPRSKGKHSINEWKE